MVYNIKCGKISIVEYQMSDAIIEKRRGNEREIPKIREIKKVLCSTSKCSKSKTCCPARIISSNWGPLEMSWLRLQRSQSPISQRKPPPTLYSHKEGCVQIHSIIIMFISIQYPHLVRIYRHFQTVQIYLSPLCPWRTYMLSQSRFF